MPRIEKTKFGAWHYEIEHLFEKYHTGFWHKLGCHPIETITRSMDNEPWHMKTHRYSCGYEKILRRHRNDEDK